MSSHDNPMEQAKKLAATPEGKQLAAILQQQGGTDVQAMLDQAAAGDLTMAKQALSMILQDPKARQLLETLGGLYGK